jgi:hypothetical protein
MIKSDDSSSTKTSFDLLDDFFLPIQWQGSEGRSKSLAVVATEVVELWRLGFLQRLNAKGQGQGKKEEEEGGPLNRFTMVKMWPIRPA